MPFTRKQYAGAAIPTSLAANISAGATTFTILVGTGWPDGSVGPFEVVINRGGATEEKVLCSGLSGTTLTVAASGRGYDGTSASAHSSGEAVEHCLTAVDLDEANQAVVATLGAVAAKGDLLVGTASETIDNLGVGADGTVLTAASGASTGMQWAAVPPPAGLPGTITTATVATNETTTSSSFGDLTTVGPAVTVTIGSSGKALVTITADITPSAAATFGIMGFALSGANTAVASTAQSLQFEAYTTNAGFQGSATYLLTGLSSGSTTFTAKYEKSGSGNALFGARSIIVWPL